MRKLMIRLAVLTAVLAVSAAVHVTPAASAAEETLTKIHLSHSDPNDLIRLLSSDSYKMMKPADDADRARQLLIPREISGMLGYPLDRSLIVKGSPEAVALLKVGLLVADVPHAKRPNDLERVTINPAHAKLTAVEEAILLLPGRGKTSSETGQLVLEGPSEWVYRALRTAVRLEMDAFKPQPQNDPAVEEPQDLTVKISLAHADPNDLMRVLSSDSLVPHKPGALSDFGSGSLIPKGILGMLGYPLDRSLLVKGSAGAIAALKSALVVADVSREKLPGDLQRVSLEPVHGKLGALLDAVRELPMPGKVTVQENRLVLEGKPEWIHQALRAAIRLELGGLKSPSSKAK